MGSNLKTGILSAIIVTALVYVALQWKPLGATSEPDLSTAAAPEITFAAPPEPVAFLPPEVPAPPQPDESSASDDTLDSDERNNIEIYRRYSRSVVNVASRTYSYDFFLRSVPADGFGSGVVIDDEGHIVTNYHVIQNANAQIEVTLADQSRHEASVVGVDPNNDLALIHVDAPDMEWIPLPMGTTRGLQVGQKVLAIGNPFGLDRTMTSGIISSLGRSIEAPVQSRQIVIDGIIQTDAAINRGNSGGPLLNTRGELIGINTANLSQATGIGFAVPVETVRRVTNDLMAYGRVRRTYLGILGWIGLADIRDLVDVLQLGTDSGVLLVNLVPGSPAHEADLRGADRQIQVGNRLIPVGGDVIVSLDGRAIRTITDISSALEGHRPDAVVPITIIRNGEEMELQITLQEEPVMQ